jgi:hypothetical protein
MNVYSLRQKATVRKHCHRKFAVCRYSYTFHAPNCGWPYITFLPLSRLVSRLESENGFPGKLIEMKLFPHWQAINVLQNQCAIWRNKQLIQLPIEIPFPVRMKILSLITMSRTASGSTQLLFIGFTYEQVFRTGRLRGWSSSPGIVKNFHSSVCSRPALGPTQPPIQMIPGRGGGSKAAWAWRWPLTSNYSWGQEDVDLYIRFPIRLNDVVLG